MRKAPQQIADIPVELLAKPVRFMD